MSVVVNKTAACISARVEGSMFDFIPGNLTHVEVDDMKKLKKVPLIARSLENGDLVTGKDAKAIAADAKKDLEDREKKEADDDKE